MNISGVNHSDLGRTYRITPIQQPETSAAFHNLYLSRLPLAPPLVIQLDCWDNQGNLIIPCVTNPLEPHGDRGLSLITAVSLTHPAFKHLASFLILHPFRSIPDLRICSTVFKPSFDLLKRYTPSEPPRSKSRYDELPFLVCHLSLETPSGDDATMIQSDGVVEAMLYGTLVAAPTEMTDQAGASGIYFAFPDVSVRYVGEFRIRANVMRITGGQALDSTLTTTFDIVEPSDYVAPPLTDLTKHFDAQGIVKFGLPRSEW